MVTVRKNERRERERIASSAVNMSDPFIKERILPISGNVIC